MSSVKKIIVGTSQGHFTGYSGPGRTIESAEPCFVEHWDLLRFGASIKRMMRL
jgi:hypothetical protein